MPWQRLVLALSSFLPSHLLKKSFVLWLGSVKTLSLWGDTSCLRLHTEGGFRSTVTLSACGRRAKSPIPSRDHLLLSHLTSGKA